MKNITIKEITNNPKLLSQYTRQDVQYMLDSSDSKEELKERFSDMFKTYLKMGSADDVFLLVVYYMENEMDYEYYAASGVMELLNDEESRAELSEDMLAKIKIFTAVVGYQLQGENISLEKNHEAYNYHEFQVDPDDQEDVDMTGEQVEIDFGGYGF